MADVSVKMGVSGISQFKQGMNQAQASVKSLDAQLKLNEKQFKATGDAETYLQQKMSLLQSKMNSQKSAVANAEAALKSLKDSGVSPLSTAYQNMQAKMAQAQAGLLDTEQEIQNIGIESQEAAGKTDELASSLGGLNKKVSLEQVRSAIGSITNAMEQAARKAVDLGKALWDEVLEAASRADNTATMAEMYGIDLQRFKQMQGLVVNGMDTTVEAMLTAQDKLKRGIGKDSKEVIEYLQQLGVSTKEWQTVSGQSGASLVQKDQVKLFWEVGQALMAMTDAYDKESAAQALFGRSWKELVPLFNTYKTVDDYNAALEDVEVSSEKSTRDLAALNDAVSKLEGTWISLKDEMLGAIAPALTGAADSLSQLIGKILDYLKTDEGQQALEDLGTAVSGLFEDLGKIDPGEVVEGFTKVFNTIIEGVKWLVDNKGAVGNALIGIVTTWGGLKLAGGALDVLKLVNGIRGLTGGAEAAKAAGAAAGASWGSAFASAVASAAPWLVFGYTLLNPAGTGDNSLADAEGNITQEGLADYQAAMTRFSKDSTYRDANGWIEDMLFVGELFEDLGSISYDLNAINAINKFRGTRNIETLISSLEALGYVLKAADELPESNLPEEVKQVPVISDEVIYKDRRQKQKEIDTLKEELSGETVHVKTEPDVPEDAATTISEAIGEVDVPVHFIVEDLTDEEYEAFFGEKPHANGLYSVPFDGYHAVLHKGERVLPAREVSSRSFSSNLYVESMYMNNNQDAAGLASAMAAAQRRTMAGYGS